MRTLRPAWMLSSALGLLAAAPALAQDKPTDAAGQPAADTQTGSGAEAPTGLREDVIVTAQKREQSLIDVPQSVSVVSGATLERQQATEFKDYLKLVPGLQLNQSTPGFGRLVLRGINTGGVATTVAVYQDETVFGSSSGLVNGATLAGDFDTFDVARIEVLRGPQGTLYGSNALGGVLKFVTNKPDTTKIEARGRASVETTRGGDESYMGSAVINLPLADTFAVRASGFYRDIGGFIDSIGTPVTFPPPTGVRASDRQDNINGHRSYGGRAAALFKPTSDFSIELSAYLQNLDVDASDSVDADPLTSRTRYGRPTQTQFTPEFSDVRYRVYSGVLNYDFGFASLVSATSYSTLRQTFRSDLTPSYGPIINGILGVANDFYQDQTTKVRRFTQEVRLQSPDNDTFEWLVGGYYSRERGSINQNLVAATPGSTTPIAGLPLLGVAAITSRYREFAGFANATLHFGERFDLSVGGRYSDNKQSADQSSNGALAGGPSVLPTANSQEHVFTYSASPKYNFSKNASLYARVAKGYRPGGPNILPVGANPAFRSFRSDSLISYEAGVKAQTADRTFSVDLAAFHIDWKNIQVFGRFTVPPPGVSFGANFNGGKAKSDGFEFTTTLRPTSGLTASFNGAYTVAKLRDDTPTTVGGLKGDALPYTPKWSIGANADYEWALGGDARGYVGGSIRTLDRQNATYNATLRAANGRQPTIPSYTVVDARAGVDLGRFSIEVYAKNLGNSNGKTSLDLAAIPNVPFGGADAGIIRPRTIGLTLGAGF